MADIGSMVVTLSLRAKDFNSGLRDVQRNLKATEDRLKPTIKLLDGLQGKMRTAGIGLTAALTAPIAAVAGLGIQFNALQEQSQITFTTMLGSGTKAKVFLEDLKDFAAKTPFEFPDLVRGSQRLLAMGFAAEEIRPLLTTVGDAAAALGSGSEGIDRITLALGQMQGRGRIATQEMNQLTEAGINGWKIIGDGLHVSQEELRKMVEKGMVPASKALPILIAGMDKAFGGLMAKQANTFSGLLSTIKDDARFIAGDLTTGLFNTVKGPLKQGVEILEKMRTGIHDMSDSTKSLIALTAGGLAVIGPALIGVSGTMWAIKTTIEGIITLRAGLFAVTSLLTGVGKVGSLAELKLAVGLYAEAHGGLLGVAAGLGLVVLQVAAVTTALVLLVDTVRTVTSVLAAAKEHKRANVENKLLKAGQSQTMIERANAASIKAGRGPYRPNVTDDFKSPDNELFVFGVPFLAKGTPYVRSDGLAYLHKGEAVIPAQRNRERSNITINISGVRDHKDLVNAIKNNRGGLRDALEGAY